MAKRGRPSKPFTARIERFEDILQLATKKRGRPRVVSWDEILPELLNAEDAARADAMGALHRWQTRNRGGRPVKDRARDLALLSIPAEARRAGTSQRDIMRKRFSDDPDEVLKIERRANKLKKKALTAAAQVREEDCACCGRWPAADRPSMRVLINRIPLEGKICEGCLMAWWHNCVAPPPSKPAKPKH
jgi:hypothetical protein